MKLINEFGNEYNYDEIKNDYMTISSIVNWYEEKVNISLDNVFFEYMAKIGMIHKKGYEINGNEKTPIFSLNEINNLMLIHSNGELVENEEKQYLIKENRIIAISQVKDQEDNMFNISHEIKKISDDKKFKITKIGNNKLKLIKIK